MYRLKSCPRCRGDLYLDWCRAVGYYRACCQCGQQYYGTRHLVTAKAA